MNWLKIPLLNPGDGEQLYSLNPSFGSHTKPHIEWEENVEFNNSTWKYVLILLSCAFEQIGRIRRDETLSSHIPLIVRILVLSDPSWC